MFSSTCPKCDGIVTRWEAASGVEPELSADKAWQGEPIFHFVYLGRDTTCF